MLCDFLGIPVPLEIERKFLITKPNLDNLMNKYNADCSEILQTYLLPERNNEELRIRQRGKMGSSLITLLKR